MRHQRCVAIAIVVGMGLLTCTGVAWAQDPIHKMGRGVVNVLTGWVELPKQIGMGFSQEHPFTGAGSGFLEGVKLLAVRMGMGLYETVTFPVAYPKDYASPYVAMELNDYVWD